jgi:hypothetical protein
LSEKEDVSEQKDLFEKKDNLKIEEFIQQKKQSQEQDIEGVENVSDASREQVDHKAEEEVVDKGRDEVGDEEEGEDEVEGKLKQSGSTKRKKGKEGKNTDRANNRDRAREKKIKEKYSPDERIVPRARRESGKALSSETSDQEGQSAVVITEKESRTVQGSQKGFQKDSIFRGFKIGRFFKGFLGRDRKKKKTMVKDPGKKRRILFLAFLIASMVFGLKMWREEQWEFTQALLIGGLAFLISYLGLIWSFRFNITRKSLTRVLPQASIFTFSAVLFIVLFFFNEFERIYESIIFVIFLIGFVILMTLVFLTSNILNVSLKKRIPLFRAGQTASYAITLLTVFFVTSAFVSSGMAIWYVIPVLSFVYTIVFWLHLSHFSQNGVIFWYSLGLAWAGIVVLFSFLFWPISPLLMALVPVAVVYAGLGVVMYFIGQLPIKNVVWEFAVFAIVVILFVMFQARWGIGGVFWM